MTQWIPPPLRPLTDYTKAAGPVPASDPDDVPWSEMQDQDRVKSPARS
ncbi:MAG: hypothetical protein MZU91_06635 [Desulfosudis oleivorans]|nr:hypothetical protein [Desulfosudis oleivorans]